MHRVTPTLVALLVALGVLWFELQQHGLIGSAARVVLAAIASSAVVVVTLAWGARAVRREIGERRALDRVASYRLFARNLPGGGIFVFDRELRYTLVESNGLESIGLTPADLEGRTIFEIFPPEVSGPLERLYREALAGRDRSEEMELLGEAYLVTVIPDRDEAGAVVGGVVLSQRISEQKKLEAQLFQAQKMEAIGQLAGGVAHDFNNLLLAIRGYAELAQRDPERSADSLTQVIAAADRAAALTGQLLAFSRRQVVHPELVDVNDVVGETKALLAPLLGEEIEIVADLAPGVPAVVVDRNQLVQILMNLAVNARDAMPRGGRLTIATEDVELAEEWGSLGDLAPGAYVRLSVTDTGSGIEPSVLPRVFEPFFTTKGQSKGTGLGLSTVYGIARQYDGAVHVYSEPGEGTTFSVYLPQAQAGVAERDTRRPRATAGRADSASILLVEDDEVVRRVVAEMLVGQGHRVTVAASPDEALAAMAAGGGFALLVTDFVLPGLSGWELARRIRETAPSIRVLFTSGYANHEALGDAVLADRAAFLQKPFSSEALADAVRAALAEDG